MEIEPWESPSFKGQKKRNAVRETKIELSEKRKGLGGKDITKAK